MSPNAGGMLVVQGDDLGLALASNEGVREAYKHGHLTNASLVTNGSAVDSAVADVIPDCPGLGIGLHLNIVDGQSLRRRIPKNSRLCNPAGNYKTSFFRLLYAHATGDKGIFDEVEEEYRSQIEAAFSRGIVPAQLNSHQHFHMVPSVFEITCKLAVEYSVPYVRISRERFSFGGGLTSHLGAWYPANLIKHVLLNALSHKAVRIAERFGVKTNDFFIGATYTGHMSGATLRSGLARVSVSPGGVVEALLHPCKPQPGGEGATLTRSLKKYVGQPARAAELATLLDNKVFQLIKKSGWTLTSYSKLAELEASSNAAVMNGT